MADTTEHKSSTDVETRISAQIDPALQPEHQHHHAHHHHTAFAEQGREEEVVYSKDTTLEKGIVPEPTALDHASKSPSDEEIGESQPAKRPWQRRMLKHRRHVAHAVIWLLFTG
jgi:CNT family concentrative nucleoside transporter